jgi:hypothetical protein
MPKRSIYDIGWTMIKVFVPVKHATPGTPYLITYFSNDHPMNPWKILKIDPNSMTASEEPRRFSHHEEIIKAYETLPVDLNVAYADCGSSAKPSEKDAEFPEYVVVTTDQVQLILIDPVTKQVQIENHATLTVAAIKANEIYKHKQSLKEIQNQESLLVYRKTIQQAIADFRRANF